MQSATLLMILDLLAVLAAALGGVLGGVAWLRVKRREMLEAAKLVADGGEVVTPKGVLRSMVTPVAQALRPKSQIELDRLVTRLQNGGRRGRDESDRFLEEKVLWMLGGLVFGVLAAAILPGLAGLCGFLIGVLGGLVAADRLLASRTADRQDAISRGLPGAVDLLVTCLDAGLPLEQSIARVAKDLSHSEPILAEELRLTASELEAGVSLADALRRLSRRVGLDDLSAMCGVLAQASALGAPIAQTLREYAIASRRQRIALLEERAGTLSTRLTLPLAICLLPAALLIILGPAAVQLIRVFK
jgi:tight adherence protein C